MASSLETLDSAITAAAQQGLVHRTLEDRVLDGRTVELDQREVLHFGSCSYLGLEMDERVKQAAMDAVARYGSYFSASRAYMSIRLYDELEELFSELFGAHALVAPTTTLGHLSCLPVMVDRRDAVLIDRQAHNSMQMATGLLRARGIRVRQVRHNDINQLESRIQALRRDHRRIWYLADGVYSMYADLAPVDRLLELQDRYEELHLYLDDAHGMSWTGRNGRGSVLGNRELRERTVVVTSLAKGFGSFGGLLLFPKADERRLIRTCGGPMTFSGGIPPASLGASIASARIHLSDEIGELQSQLMERVRLCNRLLCQLDLPIASQTEVPIRFVGVGPPGMACNMTKRLIADGFFTNLGMYPAVPIHRSGIRFTITRHHSADDIESLLGAIAHHLPLAADQEGVALETVRKDFLRDREATPPGPRVASAESHG